MDNLTFAQTRGMLLAAADRIIASKDILTEVDSRIGDGDHGIGMHNGMVKARQALEQAPDNGNVFSLFSAMGMAMMMSMGGASGVIFGSMFMGSAAKMPPKAELTPEDMAALMQGALAAIRKRGGASVGDKTMVDAFQPAVEAMSAAFSQGFPAMMHSAALAARQGMEATKQYPAKLGRAKFLGERSIGFQDAGATSTYFIFDAMDQYVASLAQNGKEV